MRTILSWFLPCVLLGQVAASPLTELEARQDVGAASVDLEFSETCPADRRLDIQNAWDDAIRLFNDLPNAIDFNEPAAIEFFGAPALNKNYQSNIQAVLNNAKTFGQGWKITPAPWKVRINVRCNPKSLFDPNAKCRENMARKAFTWNTKSQEGKGPNYNGPDATMNMHVCNSFWLSETLDKRLNDWKDDPDYAKKYNLQNYVNRASSIVHEMMHGDRVAYAANGNHHIPDLKMDIWEYSPIPNQPGNFTKRKVNVNVYGADNDKILARTDWSKIGMFTSSNADNLSQYVLAKYVQKRIGGYPWLPVVDGQAIKGSIESRTAMIVNDGSDWGVLDSTYRESLKTGGEDRSFTVHSDDAATQPEAADPSDEIMLPALTGLKWVGDEQYPNEYIKQLKEAVARAGQVSAPGLGPGPGPGPGLAPPALRGGVECNGLGTKKYMSVATLSGNIPEFCKHAVAQGVQDPGSGSITKKFNQGTLDEVEIAVDWAAGVKAPFDETECNKELKAVSTNCDGSNPDNPMDHKAGGRGFVANPNPPIQVIYHIRPQQDRQALPNTPGGSCDVRWKAAIDEFWIWGNGYATSDWGQKEGGLLQGLKSCGGSLSEWSFSYGLGNDGREWSAHGKVLVGKAWCVEQAIRNAGGPQNVDCSGNT